jgi:hypothetical protein
MRIMTEEILNYARTKGFRPQTLERWLGLAEPARSALLELARELKVGENHLRDIVDWIEEVSLRDAVDPDAILKSEPVSKIMSDPRLGRSDKLKRVKEELRRLRFPRLARVEEEIRERIRALKLGPQIEIRVPPGLEGGFLTVQLKAASHRELKSLVETLGKSLEADSLKEIFDFLSGERS